MTIRSTIAKVFQQEDINFLLTNRVPRHLLTLFMGWFSKLEQPAIRSISIGLWRLFADLDLTDARKTEFRSLHDCFTRQLKADARVVDLDPAVLASPCDAIVGASGAVEGTQLFQAKGFPYSLHDLLNDKELVEKFRDGIYVTLRLTSSMYHRFHAPYNCQVHQVNYISGDTWNVNAIALRRVEKLFCKNERAVIQTELSGTAYPIILVPVAAILVASIRLHFLDVLLHLRYRGPNVIACHAALRKGDEMGWFQHGSTIIVFAPKGFRLCDSIESDKRVRMGERLMFLPSV